MTHFTRYNDRKIAYSVFGNVFPIVFVHGFCEDRSIWNEFIEPFIKKYKVITVDIGGFGETELPKACTIETMSAQVNAVLIVEKIEQCILIGHSMGGYVGYSFVEQFGEKLQGLCIFHSHPFGDTPKKKVDRDRGIKFIKRYGSEKYVTSMLLALFSFDHGERFKMIVQKLILKACKYSEKAIINGLVAMKNRKNSANILEQTNCPVQFIIGKKDVAISWDDSLKQTSLPNIANIRIFEKVGHMGMFEAKEQTQQAILEFILKCKAFGMKK